MVEFLCEQTAELLHIIIHMLYLTNDDPTTALHCYHPRGRCRLSTLCVGMPDRRSKERMTSRIGACPASRKMHASRKSSFPRCTTFHSRAATCCSASPLMSIKASQFSARLSSARSVSGGTRGGDSEMRPNGSGGGGKSAMHCMNVWAARRRRRDAARRVLEQLLPDSSKAEEPEQFTGCRK
jgi:hypothetical protein